MSVASKDALSLQRAVSVSFIKNSGALAVAADRGNKNPRQNPVDNTKERSAQTLSKIEFTDDNIGAQFHGSLVDVDIDVKPDKAGEAGVRLAMSCFSAFLPPCYHVWGRASKPRSHYAYKLRDTPLFERAMHPILAIINRDPLVQTEVRGGPIQSAQYTLLPSSIHDEGEEYVWADVGAARANPIEIEPEVLIAGMRKAAAAIHLVPLLVEGMRQNAVMALAGFFHKVHAQSQELGEGLFAMDLVTSWEFTRRVLELAGDDTTDRSARRQAFELTWKKAENGKAVTGAKTIRELSGDDKIIKALYDYLSDIGGNEELDRFYEDFYLCTELGLTISVEAAKKGGDFLWKKEHLTFVTGNRTVMLGKKKTQIASFFHKSATVTRVDAVDFLPNAGEVFEANGRTFFNTWNGFETKPYTSPVTDNDVEPFLYYVRSVVACDNQEHSQWVLAWLADLVQRPEKKPGTALVLVGIEGTGKTFFGEVLVQGLVGPKLFTMYNDFDRVVQKHNTQLEGKLFVCLNECVQKYNKKGAEAMKSLITESRVVVEPKGVKPYDVNSFARFLLTSNDEEGAAFLASGTNDRRYTVLRTSDKHAGDHRYWTVARAWFEDSVNMAKIMRWLMDHNYEKSLINRPVMSDAKLVAIQSSASDFDIWLSTVAESKELFQGDVSKDQCIQRIDNKWVAQGDTSVWPEEVSTRALYDSYKEVAGKYGIAEFSFVLRLKDRGILSEKAVRRNARYFDRDNIKIDTKVNVHTICSYEEFVRIVAARSGRAFNTIDEEDRNVEETKSEF